ncbi:hypothetical protein EHS25_002414 [Saitozyma podzolica]|uniref:Zinc finger RING-type eukaryotic domain-containing protein n=1 Tax=Saitozyma podzolica TaxID=1890683 RepID=A0A427YE21_9TREE|nr:hypothetical protein EHS25_002414 [Saitozyma podzolica]
MGRSHAKNNTTQSTLTYYERSLLRKDGQARRIGGDSMKPLDSCYLCLSTVNDPVSCGKGHIYCRECAISNLITQKAGIETQRREMERWEANEAHQREEARARARERVVLDFEKAMGLGSVTGRRTLEDVKAQARAGEGFKLDQGTMDKAATEAEAKAMAVIEAEQAEARKSKLAAFWLPSLAPEAKLGPLKDIKLQTLCHAGGEQPHPFSRKTLLPVILTYPPSSGPSSSSKPVCPSCHKELSNATSSFLLSSRSPAPSDSAVTANGDADEGRKKKKAKKDKEDPFVCGHVVCKTCVDAIVRPQGRCCVCEAKLEEGEKGLIPLGKEGTGYAAAGGAEVKKSTIAFRV